VEGLHQPADDPQQRLPATQHPGTGEYDRLASTAVVRDSRAQQRWTLPPQRYGQLLAGVPPHISALPRRIAFGRDPVH
jgi:hypothetical protein